jgi:hypothetical protein
MLNPSFPQNMNPMQPPRLPGRIHPKISTMPRQQSEAAHYLDIYKLTIEKKRLQLELDGLDQRRQRLQDRITTLESQIDDIEAGAHRLRESVPASRPASVIYPPMHPSERSADSDFRILTLEY